MNVTKPELHQNTQTHCQQCNVNKTQKNLLLCGRCKIVYFCGVECQKAAWPLHKIVCKAKPEDEKEAPIVAIARSTSILPSEKNPSMKELEKYLLTLKVKWESQLCKIVNRLDWLNQAELSYEKLEIFFMLPKAKANETVVDLGSGCGSYAIHALDQGYKTIAIDKFSGFEKMLVNYKRKFGDQMTLIEGDIFKYKFPKSVSIITAIQIFQYCPPHQIIPLFKAIYESLKNEGSFIFTLWHYKGGSPKTQYEMDEVGGWSIPNLELVTNALTEMGFAVKVTEQGPSLPLVLFRCTKKE